MWSQSQLSILKNKGIKLVVGKASFTSSHEIIVESGSDTQVLTAAFKTL